MRKTEDVDSADDKTSGFFIFEVIGMIFQLIIKYAVNGLLFLYMIFFEIQLWSRLNETNGAR